jgi:sterol desaturase/sphingolipid hydroxylase (fatty acid hydroxylase superfamily)
MAAVTSGFSPRLEPRPAYRSNADVVRKAVVRHVLGIAKIILFVRLVQAPYAALATWWTVEQGWSERSLFVAGITVLHSGLYWSVNSFFLACDRRGWLEQYKLERTDAMGPSENLLARTYREALFGQLVAGPVVAWYLWVLAHDWGGMPSATAVLPPVGDMALFFGCCMLVNEWGFYWVHRIAHSAPLYAAVHKQHHTYKGTIGFAAEFAGPVEQALANQIPTMGYAILSGGHPLLQLAWLAGRLAQTYEAHSGFCFRGTKLYEWAVLGDEAPYHDFHHTKNSGNFGAEYIDHFFGTMDAWLRVGGTPGYVGTKREGVVGNVLRNDHPKRVAAALADKQKAM